MWECCLWSHCVVGVYMVVAGGVVVLVVVDVVVFDFVVGLGSVVVRVRGLRLGCCGLIGR